MKHAEVVHGTPENLPAMSAQRVENIVNPQFQSILLAVYLSLLEYISGWNTVGYKLSILGHP